MENSPDFEKALNEECERQYRGWLFGGGYAKASSKDRIGDTVEEMQRRRREIEDKADDLRRHANQVRREAMIRANPHMREITENLVRKHGFAGPVCPECGKPYYGNRKNGKPWCVYCDKPVKPKPRSFTFKEVDGVTGKRRR
jgi:RNA polymerase-binding transcription factor DksA